MSRCDSAAIVPNTSDDLPEPDTPVNTVKRRLGISTLTSFRLFTRAPWTRIRSWLSAECRLEADMPRSCHGREIDDSCNRGVHPGRVPIGTIRHVAQRGLRAHPLDRVRLGRVRMNRAVIGPD